MSRGKRRKESISRKGQTMNQELTPNLIHIKRVAPQATKPHKKKTSILQEEERSGVKSNKEEMMTRHESRYTHFCIMGIR
jgi:hypothetical protein